MESISSAAVQDAKQSSASNGTRKQESEQQSAQNKPQETAPTPSQRSLENQKSSGQLAVAQYQDNQSLLQTSPPTRNRVAERA